MVVGSAVHRVYFLCLRKVKNLPIIRIDILIVTGLITKAVTCVNKVLIVRRVGFSFHGFD